MEQPLPDKTFKFSAAINGHYVTELYAGDYEMIEETFADVFNGYDEFVERIFTTYHDKDVPALKSAVHKIKPLFGFVGLTDIQTQCLHFENACQGGDITRLADSFAQLKTSLLSAKSIIREEKERLEAFNRS